MKYWLFSQWSCLCKILGRKLNTAYFVPGCPADQAKVEATDEIVEVNGRSVKNCPREFLTKYIKQVCYAYNYVYILKSLEQHVWLMRKIVVDLRDNFLDKNWLLEPAFISIGLQCCKNFRTDARAGLLLLIKILHHFLEAFLCENGNDWNDQEAWCGNKWKSISFCYTCLRVTSKVTAAIIKKDITYQQKYSYHLSSKYHHHHH